jgi:hypothetical protein
MCCSFKQFKLSRNGRWSDCAINESRFEEVVFWGMRGCNCFLCAEVWSAEKTSIDGKKPHRRPAWTEAVNFSLLDMRHQLKSELKS